jgi:hypothetical protein
MTHWTKSKYENKIKALKEAAEKVASSNKTAKGAQKKSATQNKYVKQS